jgi:predicted Zn-dependent peptidase
MKTIKLDVIDEKIYYEKLDNGLEIYVSFQKKFTNNFACFLTKFGGLDIEFIPEGEKEMVKMPSGIAHFLEHKLFEQEKGTSVHDFYKKSGTYVNASTNYKTTRYIFSGPNNFKENLEFLLDFVQKPYFTDKNVEKEKGIILEEENMTRDNPNRLFFETINRNLFTKIPYNNNVIGTRKDISRITKEDLYKCYNTFYNPSNMALFIVSNIDPKEVFNIVRSNQNKKKFNKINIIKKEYEESLEVRKEKEIIHTNVNETRVSYSLKFDINSFNAKKIEIYDYINIYLNLHIGDLSKFNLDLKTRKIIKDDIEHSVSIEKAKDKEYVILTILAITDKTNQFISLLEEELVKKDYKEEDFNIYKKSMFSSLIYQFCDTSSIMNYMTNEYLFNDKIDGENILVEKNLNYNRFKEIINKLVIKNKSIVILKK